MSGSQEPAQKHRTWAEREDELLRTQRAALRVILRSCVEVIDRSLTIDSEPDPDPRTVWTPHEVFCIDGGRGSGKTFTLSSLPHVLDALSSKCLGKPPIEYIDWNPLLTEVGADKLRDSVKRKLKGGTKGKPPPPEALAHVLRIIFPGDMEGGESVMEAFFAALLKEIEDEINEAKKNIASKGKEETYINLKKSLRDVAEGFYFAKRFGVDAIIRDSVDYEDLVAQFEVQSRKASHRTRAWRRFVFEYLKQWNFPVLIILLDDSDVEADLTRDLLHAIRMFLCHPRIITVLAGNTRSMRDSLVHHGMRRLGASIPALDQGNKRTAQDWRQAMRKDAEYYLEKVLPQERRCFIGPPELSFTAGTTTDPGKTATTESQPAKSGEIESDFRKVAQDDFRSIIERQANAARGAFLRSKFHLAIEYENDRSDAPDRLQRRDIEDFLAWWVFANRYAGPLAPRSARQIKTFKAYYVDNPKEDKAVKKAKGDKIQPSDAGPTAHGTKRLPVMLHDVPENYTLIQRLGDEDVGIVSWLWQQELKSEWTGQRCFKINGRAMYQGTYTYDYLRYRLDVNLAMPMRKNSEESVPAGLLPTLHGRRYMRRFFQPLNMQRQQRRVGLVRWIDHAALPGNCTYFCDLVTLPDLSLKSNTDDRAAPSTIEGRFPKLDEELSRGGWEASLAGRWMELIAEDQNERLIRYLTRVTFDRLRWTEGVESTALISILDNERNYYEDFVSDEIDTFFKRKKKWSASIWSDAKWSLVEPHENSREAQPYPREIARRKFPDDPAIDPPEAAIEDAQNIIARHAALISDLRRAWHAIRIHEAAPRRPIESGETAGASQEQERTSNEIIANQGRMELYSHNEIEKVFNGSPWIASLLKTFRHSNQAKKASENKFIEELENAFEASGLNKTDYDLADVSKQLYSLHLGQIKSDVKQEQQDYDNWCNTLRGLGRALCADWPVYDEKNYSAVKSLEKKILHSDQLDVSSKDESNQNQQRGREARNFVLLLYGLAPSLSAIIHTQMMAEVLHYEFRSAADHVIRDTISSQLKNWIELVGALSVAFRYIKIKCMHLFAKLFINRLCEDLDNEIRSLIAAMTAPTEEPDQTVARPKEENEDLDSSIANLLDAMAKSKSGMTIEALHLKIKGAKWQSKALFRQCEIDVDLVDSPVERLAALRKLSRELQIMFGAQVAENLAIMPDIAPSTLFGDRWMVELIKHRGIRNALIEVFHPEDRRKVSSKVDVRPSREDPLDVRGIFSETEQWLWATNRCLRKWEMVIESTDFKPLESPESADPGS